MSTLLRNCLAKIISFSVKFRSSFSASKRRKSQVTEVILGIFTLIFSELYTFWIFK